MNIFETMTDALHSGRTLVIATVVRTEGSSPRAVGAKMIVFDDKSIAGTVGGGTFEKQVIEDCLSLLKAETKQNLKKYRFSQSGDNATGMVCGGEAEV